MISIIATFQCVIVANKIFNSSNLRALPHWTPSSLGCSLFSFLPQTSIESAFVRIQTSWVLLLPNHFVGSAGLGILILPQDPLESNFFFSICFSAPDNPEEFWDAQKLLTSAVGNFWKIATHRPGHRNSQFFWIVQTLSRDLWVGWILTENPTEPIFFLMIPVEWNFIIDLSCTPDYPIKPGIVFTYSD